MSQPRYERYKEALRRGHVAALRGRSVDAISAYEEAATLAPDRALPHVGLAAAFRAAGRSDDALAAYGRALARAPLDEGALGGRSSLLADLGRRAEAADDLTTLASSLETAGRLADAADAARRALELAESRTRRRLAERLADRVRSSGADAEAIAGLEGAMRVLEPGDALGADVDAAPTEPAMTAATATGEDRDGAGELAARPETEPDIPALEADVVIALTAGDLRRVRDALLAVARAHRRAGRWSAAMDACLRLLTILPADGELHATIAELQVDRGWRAPASEKLRLLGRYAELTEDPGLAARVVAIGARSGDRT